MAAEHFVGRRVLFAPNPRWPDRKLEARVVRTRSDSRIPGARHLRSRDGWLDTIDDDGVERSVRPSRCEILA